MPGRQWSEGLHQAIESKENVETHKAFFVQNNDKIMQDFVQSSQDLEHYLEYNEKEQLSGNIRRLHSETSGSGGASRQVRDRDSALATDEAHTGEQEPWECE